MFCHETLCVLMCVPPRLPDVVDVTDQTKTTLHLTISTNSSTMEKSDRNGNGAEHSDKPAPKPPPKRSLLSHIPPWITEALHNRRAWKNFARSLLAVFIMTVMMVANKCACWRLH